MELFEPKMGLLTDYRNKHFAQPYSPIANKAATAAYSWVTNLIQSTLCYQSNK